MLPRLVCAKLSPKAAIPVFLKNLRLVKIDFLISLVIYSYLFIKLKLDKLNLNEIMYKVNYFNDAQKVFFIFNLNHFQKNY